MVKNPVFNEFYGFTYNFRHLMKYIIDYSLKFVKNLGNPIFKHDKVKGGKT